MKTPSKFSIIMVILALVIIATSLSLFNSDEVSASTQSTDDAYIQADFTTVTPQVSGIVTHVFVNDYDTVKTGDLLYQIDDREYQIALKLALSEREAAQANIEAIKAKTVIQEKQIAIAQSDVEAATANFHQAELDKARYSEMAADGSGSHIDKEKALTHWQTQHALLDKSKELHAAGLNQLVLLSAQLDTAVARLHKAEQGVAQAQLNLSYTQVNAPINGVVAQRHIRAGGFIDKGADSLVIVPQASMYIMAHFRETQVANMSVGDTVLFNVDAIPNQEFVGHIESFGPASSVSYAPVRPVNATGNFTKIVQRLPVKIAIEKQQPHLDVLKVGMSVIPHVQVSRAALK